ncbi:MULTISPECIES: hypothetical protein [unclassified Streptomyces]|uniref:hypothetical protein n=1 Tax=unclassified Streptomyces TaxID=2593676 RepID=UPI002250419C|nr:MULTISPECIES: hypothetical protein [unclassified Streptomyces]MCX4878301.1 hypothetical protein [Streptomyces sp. NBC_00847]MCX5418308.1 hypothetical protein [Streptomyces sp. NBC_00078]
MTTVACGHQDSAARAPSGSASPASPDTGVYASPLQKSDLPWSGSPSPYNAEVTLDDGRRVAMHYRRGKGLVEQHYSPRAKAWTKPKVIHRTRTDACQGIELRTSAGTVAAIADFGAYCYDGDPPTESIAAVGTGSLTRWDVNIKKDFDGWERASVSHDGSRVVFGRDVTLHWNRADGFESE